MKDPKQRLQEHLQEVLERELDTMDSAEADLTEGQLNDLVDSFNWKVVAE